MTTETRQEREALVHGLDAHPYGLTLAVMSSRDPRQSVASKRITFALSQLANILRQHTHPADTIVLEASGNSFHLARRIATYGRRAIVLESQSVSLRTRGTPKTDPLDAEHIARAYLGGQAKEVWTPRLEAAEWREIYFAYRDAVRDSVRARNRIWAMLNANGKLGDRRRRECERHGGVNLVEPGALDALQRRLHGTTTQAIRMEDEFENYRQAEARRQRLESEIARLVMSHPLALRLVRLCGIRHLVAFALLAFIDDIRRFQNPKSLVRYLGLDPSVSTSGIGGGTSGLHGAGRADLRALLVEGAKSVLRSTSGGALKRWGVALKMRRGANIAACAVARKMAVAVWHLLVGNYTPLFETDVSQALRRKLATIATRVGSKFIRAKGYATNTAYIADVLKTIVTPVNAT